MVWWAGLTHGSSDVTGWWLSCMRRVDRLGSLSKCSPAGRHVLIGVWQVPDSELTDAQPGCAPDNTEGRSCYGERQTDQGLRRNRHARRYTLGCCVIFGQRSWCLLGLPQHRLTLVLCGRGPCWKDVHHAQALSPEFRRDVVLVARQGGAIALIARDFGITESCLRNWLRRADIEDGNRPGVTNADAAEKRKLKRRNRQLEQEAVILGGAAAYFAKDISPK